MKLAHIAAFVDVIKEHKVCLLTTGGLFCLVLYGFIVISWCEIQRLYNAQLWFLSAQAQT